MKRRRGGTSRRRRRVRALRPRPPPVSEPTPPAVDPAPAPEPAPAAPPSAKREVRSWLRVILLALLAALLLRAFAFERSEEHTSELQSRENLVCRLLLEKKNTPSDDCQRPRLYEQCTPDR